MPSKARGLGLVIRAERARRGLSQLELALESGISINSVSLAERSGRLSRNVAERIAAVIGLSTKALLQPTPSRKSTNTKARAVTAGPM